MSTENLFDGIPSALPEELVTNIHRARGFRIERIVSQAHCSPPGFWYDQDEHEWVIVLEGTAAIQFEGDGLLAGDASSDRQRGLGRKRLCLGRGRGIYFL